MSNTAQKLVDRRVACVKEMQEVAERAVDEQRDMTGEELSQYRKLNAEVDALQGRIDDMLAGEQRAKDEAEAFAKLRGQPKEREAPSESEERQKIREFIRGKGDRVLAIPPGPMTKREIALAHGNGVEQRDVLTTTAGASGVIDTGFRAQLWEYMIETAGVLNAGVDMLQTESGETIKLPRVEVHPTAAAQTQGTAITESDPTLGSVNSTVTKEGYVTQLSRELIDDSGVDLTGYLARAGGRALGNAVGTAAVTAAVAAAAAGATTAAGELTNLGAQGTVGKGFDYIITLYHSVLAPYRASSSCAWLTSDAGAAMLRKVKSADGVYAWQASVQVGQPDTILGKPVYIDTNVADPGANAESVLFGDWRSLVVRIAGGFRFERSDEFAFNADLVTFRTLVRHGSVSVDPNALKSLTHPAA